MTLCLQAEKSFPPDTSFTFQLIGGEVNMVLLADTESSELALDGAKLIISVQRLLRAGEDWRK